MKFNPSICIPSSTLWIDALQRKADEETLVLQKLTSDWQNYSRSLSAIKTNMSSTTQNMRSLQNNVIADHQRIAMSNEVYYDLTQQVCLCPTLSVSASKMFKLWEIIENVSGLQAKMCNVFVFSAGYESADAA